MAKDPAFLFYPNDYIGGTMGWTFEEKGAYIELLMMQFNRGHMTTHMITQVVGQLWDTIQVKFIQDEKGLWYNKRLEDEQNKRKNFTESRRNNLSGVNQHTKTKKKNKAHTTTHKENGDINENKDSNRIVVYPFDSEKFIEWWKLWKEYKKKEHKFQYKSEISEQAALKELSKLSNGVEDVALKIIEQSISKSWKGFFELKSNISESGIDDYKKELLERAKNI